MVQKSWRKGERKREGEKEKRSEGRGGQRGEMGTEEKREKLRGKEGKKQKEGETQRKSWREWEGRFPCSIFDLPSSPLTSPLYPCSGTALEGPCEPCVIPGHAFAVG